ncbi:MAG TPA: response regulator [Planctomycetota bacterium]
MVDPSALKALSKETKALIIVSEFEARRMPMFQLRAVLDAVIRDDQEKKAVIDLVENDLRATGYTQEQISAFLSDLLLRTEKASAASGMDQQILSTRKLRSPFAMTFEATSPTSPPPDVPKPGPGGTLLRPAGQVTPPGTLGHTPATGVPRQTVVRRAPFLSGVEAAPPPDTAAPPPDLPPAAEPAPLQIPLPAPVPAPPPPPVPPPASLPPMPKSMSGPAAQRRATMIFEDRPKPPAATVVPVTPPPIPRANAGLPPAGDRTSARQDLIFGAMAQATGSGSKPLVLLADDDKRARMVFRMRLEDAGFATVEFDNGISAWERLQQGGVALAVLDMKMPGLHGLEVLTRISDKQLGIPVVVCTAYDQLEDEFIVQTYPKLKYMTKPIAPDKLVQAVKDLLGEF